MKAGFHPQGNGTAGPAVEVVADDGVPRLAIDGVIQPAHAFFQYKPIAPHVAGMAQAGLGLFSWGCECGWIGPGTWDFTGVDTEAATILAAAPNAWLLPRVLGLAPDWWMDGHPDQCVHTFAEGRPTPILDWRRTPSPASTLWLDTAEEALRRFVSHVLSRPYADRVIGFHVCGGIEEWMCSFRNPVDFSAAARAGFAAWLRATYGDEAGLRAAWRDPVVTFESVTVPTPEQRVRADKGFLRDPAAGRTVADYGLFLSEATAAAVVRLCRTIKRETGGRRLAGVFYGYLINSILDAHGAYDWGHNAVRRVADATDVDFVCSPNHYTFTGPGGFNGPQAPVDAFTLRGKLWFCELDQNTFLGRAPRTTAMHACKPVTNPIPSPDETIWRMTRDFSSCFINRQSLWWMEQDYDFSRYDHPALLTHLDRLTALLTERDGSPIQRACEIAVVLDEESRYYLTQPQHALFSLVYAQIHFHLARLGAPFSIHLHNDLARADMPEYKLYIFLDTLFLTLSERNEIARHVRRQGKTSLWLYAPGLIDPDGIDPCHMTALTGLGLKTVYDKRVDGGNVLLMHLTEFDHPCVRDVAPGLVFGTDTPFSPLVYVDDPQASALGEYLLPSRRSGPVGFAAREFSEWRSIFCGAPNMPAPLLRAIAHYAGCHLYTADDDVVYANSRYLAIQATRGGERRVALPRPLRVEDALTGRCVSTAGVAFTDTLERNETRLYRLVNTD
jgi:hypothetical protein